MEPDQWSEFMTSFWNTETMYHESVLMVADARGETEAVLLFEPESIVAVRDSTLRIVYEEGADWVFADGKLRLPPGSRAARLTRAQLFPDAPDRQTVPRTDGQGYVYTEEGHFFHEHQLFVTYTHRPDAWKGPVPRLQERNLAETLRKLRAGLPLTVVLYGDSISEGYNASGFHSGREPVAPFLPAWGELFAEALRRAYGSPVQFRNASLAGKDTVWGAERVGELVSPWRPDLVVLAFGMNDGTGRRPPDEFRRNLEAIMADVRKANPHAEFVLVSPMLANPATRFHGNQSDYRLMMEAMTGEGVAMADMTAVHAELLKRKRYHDMTGNHLNHPNDFLMRWYAQQVAGLLVENL